MTPSLAHRMRVPWILWAAMLMSTGVYLLVLAVAQRAEAPPDRLMAILLNVVALGIAVSSVAVPLLLWRVARATLEPGVDEVPDHDAEPGLFRDAVPTKRVIPEGRELVAEALTKVFTPFVLSLALSEAVCIFGFLVAFLGHPPLLWVPLYALGVVLLLLRAPKLSRLVRNLEAHFDAELAGVP